ncbi:MAG: glucose 1-dehydrogenase [Candidatus Omnitrophota bacterium]|nr:glucose 1-dehydrogenase [Candidatus Omnitrophota bacterium]
MKAIAVIPKKKTSARLVNIEDPKITDTEVLVKVIRVGIDGTDSEINEGLYGEAPEKESFLIIGHESFGVVEEIGKGSGDFKKGDYVVATVRRPCGICINCANGESDMCLTGRFKERGIMGLHGFMAEYYKEIPDFLIKVPAEFKEIGVFLEPLSIVEKAICQVFKIQDRMKWNPKNALVLGAGSIGLLATMLLREKGLTTYTIARSPKGCFKSDIAQSCGSVYIDINETSLLELKQKIDNIDIIIEATGSSKVAFDAMQILAPNGVLCLTSITGGESRLEILADKINLDMVLGNKIIFGTVNANRKYFEMGVTHFQTFQHLWPGLLEKMITRRYAFQDFKEGLDRKREDIKIVLEIGEI